MSAVLSEAPRVGASKRRVTFKKVLDNVGVRILLIVMSILFLIPLYWTVVTALKQDQELAVYPPTLIPHVWAWENFSKALDIMPYGTYFMNSVLITGLNIIGALISGMLVAYGFACINWPGRDKVFYVVLATIFLPTPITLIPLFDMFASLGWVNTYLPLVVPAFFGSSFNVFLLRQFLLQIPREMMEAARIDGANELQILFRVVFPMARPALAVVAILVGIGVWNDFMGPLIYIQDDSLRPLAIGLQFFQSAHDIQYNLLMAASLMVLVPVIIFFLFFQRHFIKGVVVGSIK